MGESLLITGVFSSVLASLVAGVSGSLVQYTRTQFLAIESLHMIIAAALLGSLVARLSGPLVGDIASYTSMALLTLFIASMLERGLGQEASVGAAVVLSSALASIFSFYMAASAGGIYVVFSILFGNPFLVSQRDAAAFLAAGALLLLLAKIFWRRFLHLSFDPELFEMIVGRSREHRWILYTLVSLSAIYTAKLVGAIPAHMILLAPGAVAARSGGGGWLAAVITALLAAVPSAYLAYTLNTTYGAVLGILSTAIYIAVLALPGRGR